MSNLSTAALVANEIAKVVDFSYANDQSISNIAVALRAIMTGENTDYVIGGKVTPYPSGGMNFTINPVYGHCKASGVDVIDTELNQPISVESAHSTMSRIDTVQIRGVEAFNDHQQRKFKDPETSVLSTETIATKKSIKLDVMVKKGADGSVTAPLADNGWIKLAEIFIPAGTVSLTNEHIRNITARSGSHVNTTWTIDKSRTFNPGFISEIIAKFLTAHREDGEHNANAIKAEHIRFGIEENDVNGTNMPIGKSMAIRGENFTSQIPMTTIVSAIATILNTAFPYINNLLGRYSYINDMPVAASTENIDIVTGGEMEIDGIICTVGQMVFLKNQTDKRQNGFWVVHTGAWNRQPGYTKANAGCFDSKLILIEAGTANKGKIFYLENDTYTVDNDPMEFKESVFSTIDLPGKVPMRDKNGRTIDDDKREEAIEGALLDVDSHPTMVDGDGRNLLEVLGVSTIPEAMAEIRRRCNNNGEIDDTKIPNFHGIRIGDYLDGLDFSAIGAPINGQAPQAWNDQYKNNRIVIAGLNTFKGAGDTENAKNHILFVTRNSIAVGRMNATDTNTGGYPASEMRAWLEGASGDGSGPFATGLKVQLGGDYLYSIKKYHSSKDSNVWTQYTVFLPSELEVFGYQVRGDEIAADGTKTAFGVQFPLYQKSFDHRIKRRNGSRAWWWLQTPCADSSTRFCYAHSTGYADFFHAGGTTYGGVAPAFCVA